MTVNGALIILRAISTMTVTHKQHGHMQVNASLQVQTHKKKINFYRLNPGRKKKPEKPLTSDFEAFSLKKESQK